MTAVGATVESGRAGWTISCVWHGVQRRHLALALVRVRMVLVVAMAWCGREEGALLDLLTAEQTAVLSKFLDEDREPCDVNREDVGVS